MIYIITEAKLTNFADDMTCSLKDKISYSHLFKRLKVLYIYSCLCVSDDIIELFAINSQKFRLEEVQHRVYQSIKVLNFYTFAFQKINFH